MISLAEVKALRQALRPVVRGYKDLASIDELLARAEEVAAFVASSEAEARRLTDLIEVKASTLGQLANEVEDCQRQAAETIERETARRDQVVARLDDEVANKELTASVRLQELETALTTVLATHVETLERLAGEQRAAEHSLASVTNKLKRLARELPAVAAG